MPEPTSYHEQLEAVRAKIPAHLLASLEAYVNEHTPTGGFLRAVVEGNLFASMQRADLESRAALFPICQFLYNCAPPDCFGSREKVEAWLAAKPAGKVKVA